MTVHCPHCSTGYLLPDELLGARGARVRCPTCSKAFVVLREGATVGEASESEDQDLAQVKVPTGPLPAKASALAELGDPHVVAARLLDELAARLGEALPRARADHRVLSQFGPDILGTYEEYRRVLGERGTPEVFRATLRERWAVDLQPGS